MNPINLEDRSQNTWRVSLESTGQVLHCVVVALTEKTATVVTYRGLVYRVPTTAIRYASDSPIDAAKFQELLEIGRARLTAKRQATRAQTVRRRAVDAQLNAALGSDPVLAQLVNRLSGAR